MENSDWELSLSNSIKKAETTLYKRYYLHKDTLL